MKQMNDELCERTAYIMEKSTVTPVKCILPRMTHQDEFHKDAVCGEWHEVEELDERYTP